MSSGTMSSAIASLKSNKQLRKNKESYSRFYKQIKAGTPQYQSVSAAESERRRKEAKLESRALNIQNRIFKWVMVLFYIGIISYALYVILT